MIIKTYWKSQAGVRTALDLVLGQLQAPGCAHTSPVRSQTSSAGRREAGGLRVF